MTTRSNRSRRATVRATADPTPPAPTTSTRIMRLPIDNPTADPARQADPARHYGARHRAWFSLSGDPWRRVSGVRELPDQCGDNHRWGHRARDVEHDQR